MSISNNELNRRCAFFAEHGLPYSDKVWHLLSRAWDEGYTAGVADASQEASQPNPYRGAPINDRAQEAIAYAKTNPAR